VFSRIGLAALAAGLLAFVYPALLRAESCQQPLKISSQESQWNGWGNDATQRRFQSAERAHLTSKTVSGLKLKWAFGFPGMVAAHGQPTVTGNALFVGSADGTVYALGADTGCLSWTFKAGAPVRTAISVGKVADRWAVYFGDQQGNAYAVDAVTGSQVWKARVDSHAGARITGAPTLVDGRLYVPASSSEEGLAADPKYACCSFRGSVSALDAATGTVIWKSYTIAEEPKPVRQNKLGVQLSGPSGAAIWSAPTVDVKGGMVFATTGDSYSDPVAATSDAFVAFDLKTGKLLWSRQTTPGDAFTVDCDFPEAMRGNCPLANGPDHDFGSSAILVELGRGKRALIAGQKSGVVHAIDPDREGAILWQRKIGAGGKLGGIQWGIAADGDHVYAAVSDVQIVPPPPGSDGGRPSIFGMPLMLSDKAGGGLYALDIRTGEIVWHTPHPGCKDTAGCSPGQSAAATVIPGVVFSGGLDGHLRAYDAKDGRILWDMSTLGSIDTVNGVKATGGSLDGSGAVVVDGTVYVNSGYLFLGHTPGNVLLAYSTGK
jgi:polyvinyl alcohol dehydrogenase (cytochrome)